MLARVVGRLRGRVTAVIRRDDEQVALPQGVEDVREPTVEVLEAAVGSSQGRCMPKSMSVSTRFTNMSPPSTFSSSSMVRLIPSTFEVVGNESSTSQPAKMSEIFPTP